MSTVFYRIENNLSKVIDNVKHVIKSNLIDGEKGLSFSFLEKKGDSFYRVNVKELEDKSFEVKEKKGDKEEVKKLSEADVMSMVKKDKNLTFVNDYVSKDRKKFLKGGKRKKSKKGSKSTKKKMSKKTKRSKKKMSKKKMSKKVSKKKSLKKKVTKKKGSKKM